MMAESTTHSTVPSSDAGDSGDSGVSRESTGKVEFHYEGGGFPWFLRLIWIAFAIFFIVYMIKWFVPDLMNYLDHGLDILQ